MHILLFIFCAMFLYGILINHLGGAMFSLLMVVVVRYGMYRLKKIDVAWEADPRCAKAAVDSVTLLEQLDTESSTPCL